MAKSTNLGGPNPLQCPICKEYREVFVKLCRFTAEVNRQLDVRFAFYRCDNCKTEQSVDEPKVVLDFFQREVETSVEDGENIKWEYKDFPIFNALNLKYDELNYYAIPWLKRPYDEGFLCPVFFKRDFLIFYNHHPDYRVQLVSRSYGNIWTSGDKSRLFYRGFGINRNGLIFMWLGDLYEMFSHNLDSEHLARLRISNVFGDHDIVSDYYFSQIEANFITSDNENRIFYLQSKFDELFLASYNSKFYQFDIDSIEDKYKYPVMDTFEYFFNSYLVLCKLLIENIDVTVLKNLVLAKFPNEDLSGKKGLKLLTLYLKGYSELENIDYTMMPFFVLYDLRQLEGHLESEKGFTKSYTSCKNRLSLADAATHKEVFDRIIDCLIVSFVTIINTLDSDFVND